MKLETTGYILSHVRLSPEQVAHLLTRIRDTEEEDLRFTVIALYDVNISQVSPAVLTGAISRLEDVRIGWSFVTPEQALSIFNMLASQLGDSKVKKLLLGGDGVDLTSLPPEILVGGIQRLEMIKFILSSMTADQANSILSMVSEGRQGRLNTIGIYFPAVTGGTISPVLLQSAREVGGQNLDIHFDFE